MTVGEKIRQRREELKISQYELAQLVGYKSRSSINKIEMDLYHVPQDKMKLLATALHTTPSYLLGWSDADKEYNADGKLSKELQVMDDVADTFGDAARDFLFLLNRLDDVDKARIMERMQTMLEDAKYQKEELQAN